MGWSDWISLAVTVILGAGAIVQAIRYERKGRKTQASVDQLLRDTKDQVDALDPVVTHIDGSVAAVDHNVNQVMDVMTQLYTDVLHITGASASTFLADRAGRGFGGREGEGMAVPEGTLPANAGRHASTLASVPPPPAGDWATVEEQEEDMGTSIEVARHAPAGRGVTYAPSGPADSVASMTGSGVSSSEARRQVRARLQSQDVGAQVNARILLEHVPDAALTDVLADLYRLRFARLIAWDDVVLTPNTSVIVTGRVPDAA